MATFTAPPSWFTTLRYLAHVLMPSRVEAKGFPPLSVRERDALAQPLTIFRVIILPLLFFVVLLVTGMVMTVSLIGSLMAFSILVGVPPLIVVTTVWIGLKSVVNDENDEKE